MDGSRLRRAPPCAHDPSGRVAPDDGHVVPGVVIHGSVGELLDDLAIVDRLVDDASRNVPNRSCLVQVVRAVDAAAWSCIQLRAFSDGLFDGGPLLDQSPFSDHSGLTQPAWLEDDASSRPDGYRAADGCLDGMV